MKGKEALKQRKMKTESDEDVEKWQSADNILNNLLLPRELGSGEVWWLKAEIVLFKLRALNKRRKKKKTM